MALQQNIFSSLFPTMSGGSPAGSVMADDKDKKKKADEAARLAAEAAAKATAPAQEVIDPRSFDDAAPTTAPAIPQDTTPSEYYPNGVRKRPMDERGPDGEPIGHVGDGTGIEYPPALQRSLDAMNPDYNAAYDQRGTVGGDTKDETVAEAAARRVADTTEQANNAALLSAGSGFSGATNYVGVSTPEQKPVLTRKQQLAQKKKEEEANRFNPKETVKEVADKRAAERSFRERFTPITNTAGGPAISDVPIKREGDANAIGLGSAPQPPPVAEELPLSKKFPTQAKARKEEIRQNKLNLVGFEPPHKVPTDGTKLTQQQEIENALAKEKYKLANPVNRDQGVKGFLKELLSNLQASAKYIPSGAGLGETLAILGAGGIGGAGMRTTNEKRDAEENIVKLERDLGIETKLEDQRSVIANRNAQTSIEAQNASTRAAQVMAAANEKEVFEVDGRYLTKDRSGRIGVALGPDGKPLTKEMVNYVLPNGQTVRITGDKAVDIQVRQDLEDARASANQGEADQKVVDQYGKDIAKWTEDYTDLQNEQSKLRAQGEAKQKAAAAVRASAKTAENPEKTEADAVALQAEGDALIKQANSKQFPPKPIRPMTKAEMAQSGMTEAEWRKALGGTDADKAKTNAFIARMREIGKVK